MIIPHDLFRCTICYNFTSRTCYTGTDKLDLNKASLEKLTDAEVEAQVQAFLEKKISYTAISKIVRTVLDYNWNEKIENFEDVFEKDRKARQLAMERI